MELSATGMRYRGSSIVSRKTYDAVDTAPPRYIGSPFDCRSPRHLGVSVEDVADIRRLADIERRRYCRRSGRGELVALSGPCEPWTASHGAPMDGSTASRTRPPGHRVTTNGHRVTTSRHRVTDRQHTV